MLPAACVGATETFQPEGPCTVDGQVAGAYPDLEAMIPTVFEGRPPDRLDSGRNCTPRNLGTLAAAGVEQVRFAGGLWEIGRRGGVTLAVMSAPDLTEDAIADFYEAGARAGRKTEDVTRSQVDGLGGAASRIDTLNDQSFQTIIVMQGVPAAPVRVVLVGSDVREIESREAHEALVDRAIRAWEPPPADD
jgi:hypothetical protein